MVLAYLRAIAEQESRGDAREESHYPALQALLERAAAEMGRPAVRATVMPRKTAAGYLDLQVWDEGRRWVGSIEAKRPGTELPSTGESAQIRRYAEKCENLLVTNFHDFALYRDGVRIGQAALRRLPWLPAEVCAVLARAPTVPGEADLLALLARFFDFAAPRPLGAEVLARQLARRARLLADAIDGLLAAGESAGLASFHAAFSDHLIRGISTREFADLYAQTVAYGLLAVRYEERAEAAGFGRRSLVEVPRGNGLLRDLLRYLSLEELRPEVAWMVDDLIGLLREAPVGDILRRYYHENRGKDPVHHFYETFLAEYDPALRRSRGVYYTPPELVSYVVRSVDGLLREALGWGEGFADARVRLLDPAAGTLTFVVEALLAAIRGYRSRHGVGAVPALLRDHLLVHAAAFEVMMAPYAMGHLKLHLALAEEGFPLPEDARFPFYLTNALDRRELAQSRFPFAHVLSSEAQAAAGLKRGLPVNVILGNPPYSGRSRNRFPGEEDEDEVGRWLKGGFARPDGTVSAGYYEVDGRPLGEKNPKWLQDDYVRFLRFAQWKIEQAGEGIVAFVTNHSYLDNPTFRGLRRSLLETFDELYFLDLHGARKKGEAVPGGGRDENVFDIEQGVAIALLVKAPGRPRRVFHADLYGRQGEKRKWLAKRERTTTEWSEIAPRAPAYLFIPTGEEEAYGRWPALPAIFPVHSAGIVTARDEFVLDFDLQPLQARVSRLSFGTGADNGWAGGLRETGSFHMEEARRALLEDADWFGRFHTILYRPFDERWIFYADYLVERPRRAVMRHMLLGPNLGLICPKQHKEEPGALVTGTLAGHKTVSAYDINDLFPLYLYPEPESEPQPGLLPPDGPARRTNVAPALTAALAAAHGALPSPEEVLGHVYAVLYSPPYRRRYRGLLRRGFPRIPFPRRRDLFAAMAALGAELVELHRLPPKLPGTPEVRFEGKGSGVVGEAKRTGRDYRPAEGRVYVNADRQYFEGIAPEVWAYRIGGHQVLDRWLWSRAGRLLTRAEIEGFAAAAAAIARTLEIERRLAELYPEVEAGELASP